MAPEILELIRSDEALLDRNLQVRTLELDAVADDREVHVLLTALDRELVEVAGRRDLRDPYIRGVLQLHDAHVMRVRKSQEPVPTGVRNRLAGELAFARIPRVGRLARIPVERVGTELDRSRI